MIPAGITISLEWSQKS